MSGLIRDLLAYSRVLHDDPDLFEAISLKRAVEFVCETLKDVIESNRRHRDLRRTSDREGQSQPDASTVSKSDQQRHQISKRQRSSDSSARIPG